MNITQNYVSLFFWLGSCQLGLKVFHWERKFCLFLISAVFSILEVYIYLNSVLLVFFVFLFFVFFFLGDKHGCWVSEISPWQDLCLKSTIGISRTALKTPRTFPDEGHFPSPSTEALLILRGFLNGQCSARYPCLIRLHTRLPHIKRKKKTKKKKILYEITWLFSFMHSCNIFFKNKTLYKLWARFIRKRNWLLTRDFF